MFNRKPTRTTKDIISEINGLNVVMRDAIENMTELGRFGEKTKSSVDEVNSAIEDMAISLSHLASELWSRV